MDSRIVPHQHEGGQSNTESGREFSNPNDQQLFYQQVKQRLFNINRWNEYAGEATSEFQLTDSEGNHVNRMVRVGDYMKINIPGPGTKTGEGYDWVRVEKIEESLPDEEPYTAIKVRPAPNPSNNNQDVAHFFKEEATSSFVVKQAGNKVVAAVYGRNEKPNTNADKLIDKVRNAAIGSSAISGFSKIQWKSLVDGLINFNGQ